MAEKKTKETLTKLVETEKARKSTEAVMASAERQAKEQRGHLQKAEE